MATLHFENGYLSPRLPIGNIFFQLFAPGVVLTLTNGEEGVVSLYGPHGPGSHSFGSNWGGDMGTGYASVPGHTYQKVWYAGDIKLTGSVTLQASMSDPIVTLVRRFKMSGHLVAYSTNPIASSPPPVFDRKVNGAGMAIIELTSIIDMGQRAFDLRSLNYHFMP
ncbi:MAG: hypothetical protein ABIT20_16965 [Gemmatimonadaceae bacterium]